MLCCQCNKEIDGNAKFCKYCGAKQENSAICEFGADNHKVRKISLGWKIFVMLVLMVGVVIVVHGVSGNKRNNISEENLSTPNDSVVENSALEDGNIEDSVAEIYSGGEYNTIGNSFANLGYHCSSELTGRITSQGDMLFYYEKNSIWSLDASGNKKRICMIEEASCLNVIGDTLYFLEKGKIYSIKVDGSDLKEVLINVHGPFMICNNYIYYVTSSNLSATVFEYYIRRYKIGGNEPQKSISTGEYMPILAGVDKANNNKVIYYYQTERYQDSRYTALTYERYLLGIADVETSSKQELYYIAPDNGYSCDFTPILTDDYIYVCQTYTGSMLYATYMLDVLNYFGEQEKHIEEITYLGTRNVYGNDLIIHADLGEGFALYRVDEKAIHNGLSSGDDVNYIVREESGISEVYVIGDYVYYAIGKYQIADLYRIKIDGTGWEPLDKENSSLN